MPLKGLGFIKAGQGDSEELANGMVEEILNGCAGQSNLSTQASPTNTATSYDVDMIAYYDVGSDGGLETYLMPASFDGSNNTDTWDLVKWFLSIQEVKCQWWELNRDTDYIFQFQDPNGEDITDIIEGSGVYAVEVYDDGFTASELVSGSDYAIDYDAGTVTFTVARTAGHAIYIRCFYISMAVDRIRNNATISFVKNNQRSANYPNYYIKNTTFERWTTTTQPTNWTKNGAGLTCSRNAASYQGTYNCKLISSGGGAEYISQTVTLPASTNEVTFIAVLKSSGKCKIGVSKDGAAFNYCELDTSTETNAVNKWVTLYVESPNTAGDTVYLRIYPQINTTDTSTVYVEAVALVEGQA